MWGQRRWANRGRRNPNKQAKHTVRPLGPIWVPVPRRIGAVGPAGSARYINRAQHTALRAVRRVRVQGVWPRRPFAPGVLDHARELLWPHASEFQCMGHCRMRPMRGTPLFGLAVPAGPSAAGGPPTSSSRNALELTRCAGEPRSPAGLWGCCAHQEHVTDRSALGLARCAGEPGRPAGLWV